MRCPFCFFFGLNFCPALWAPTGGRMVLTASYGYKEENCLSASVKLLYSNPNKSLKSLIRKKWDPPCQRASAKCQTFTDPTSFSHQNKAHSVGQKLRPEKNQQNGHLLKLRHIECSFFFCKRTAMDIHKKSMILNMC